MKVSNELQPLTINGQDIVLPDETRRLLVESHWIHNDRVHIKFGDHDIVVLASELKLAVDNACNHHD